jgi:glycosyltransferase involved in cell wall biosynthesis
MTMLRIAQVAPLMESVPPKYYGGTERVVSYLTENLVKMGHDVTLFASGDSQTSARLESVVDSALRLHPNNPDPLAYHAMQLDRVLQRADDFDVIHFHVDVQHFPAVRFLTTPHITTLHGRLDLPHLPALFRTFNDLPLVSISHSQRRPLPLANWQATVNNGIPAESYTFNDKPDSYLAFLGRISPEKGIEQAIEIARRSGRQLRIAAKVDKVDEEFFQARVKPHLRHPLVEYLGEIGEHEKDGFLGNAQALLFPIDWPEPFGLTMIESMACGTPVIAYRRGSVSEVMRDGVSGYIVDNSDEAVAAVNKVEAIDRAQCRQYFEQHFSDQAMAKAYLQVYQQLIEAKPIPIPLAG